MDIKKTPRTDARHASIVRQGLEWALTYGQRSAAAFLLVRKVPRPVVERIPISMDGRGRALVVVRQSRRRWEDAYSARVWLQSSDSNRPCRHYLGRLFSFQTEGRISLAR